MNDIDRACAAFRTLLEEQQARVAGMTAEQVDYTNKATVTIGLVDGDGIGPIIMEQAVRALEALLADEIARGSIALRRIRGLTLENRMACNQAVPDDVLADARMYMRIYFVGVIFLLIYNIGSGILRAIGDSKRPLYVLIVCCLCNVVLDLLFVCVFHMGVAGAAIATIATEGVSSVIILIMLARSNDCYRLNLKKIRIDRSLLGDILRIGFPAGLQSMMYSISNASMTIQKKLSILP